MNPFVIPLMLTLIVPFRKLTPIPAPKPWNPEPETLNSPGGQDEIEGFREDDRGESGDHRPGLWSGCLGFLRAKGVGVEGLG